MHAAVGTDDDGGGFAEVRREGGRERGGEEGRELKKPKAREAKGGMK